MHSIKHNAKLQSIILLAPLDDGLLLTLDYYKSCHEKEKKKRVAKCLAHAIDKESEPF